MSATAFPVDLFAYPQVPLVRRHGPLGYSEPASAKQWLRDEFAFRCVYCLFRETWSVSGDAGYAVDHLDPVSRAPHRAGEYDNLLYACNLCNSTRQDRTVPDPFKIAYGSCLEYRRDGRLLALAPAGERLILFCGLNSPRLIDWRLQLVGLLDRFRRSPDDPLLRRYFSYPDDLPALSLLRPPGGNARPEGVAQSHLARRLRGELPATY
ncbi:MAG: HNH endonuclease [Gemmataceae bacterium]|nr:HNH endonuclease [Gemmataceae bacterium]